MRCHVLHRNARVCAGSLQFAAFEQTGAEMSTGTSGEYWQAKALPSVFKHELLFKYLPPFGGMVTSTVDRPTGAKLVYLDGYAGKGRYENGDPGSAEIVLKIASGQQLSLNKPWTLFLSEKDQASVESLKQVAAEYVRRGIDARVRGFTVDTVFDEVLAAATGLPLFLFLDPCGLALPFDQLAQVLMRRPGARPATEFLLNFTMMGVRRIGGNVRSPQGSEASLKTMDAVCGGDWWRAHFAEAQADDGAAEQVAEGYASRLGKAARMHVISVPVRKKPRHKPIYNLVFGTRSVYGLWVFGDAVARAHAAWWTTAEALDEEADPGALFTVTYALRPKREEIEAEAVPAIAANLAQLLKVYRSYRVVDHTLEVFGDYYGMVTEPCVRAAIKLLHKQGGTSSTGVGKRVRELIVSR